jgi:hypothetical protein
MDDLYLVDLNFDFPKGQELIQLQEIIKKYDVEIYDISFFDASCITFQGYEEDIIKLTQDHLNLDEDDARDKIRIKMK